MSYNRQSQFELFPGTTADPVEKNGQMMAVRKWVFSMENLVVLGVLIVISMVVSFSLGVEKGRRLAQGDPAGEAVVARSVPAASHTIAPEAGPVQQAAAAQGAVQPPEQQASVQSETGRSPEALAGGQNPEAPATAEKKVDKVYTIQVASFKTEDYARKEAMGLKRQGYDIMVMPKGRYSIVCVGRFSHKEAAAQFSKKLKSHYKDLLIRSL